MPTSTALFFAIMCTIVLMIIIIILLRIMTKGKNKQASHSYSSIPNDNGAAYDHSSKSVSSIGNEPTDSNTVL